MLKYILQQDKAVFKEVFTLAFPVILSNLSRVLMSVVDVATVSYTHLTLPTNREV